MPQSSVIPAKAGIQKKTTKGRLPKKCQLLFAHNEGCQNVPSEVCTKCGEKTYSPEVTDELLKFAKYESKPVKIIKVPVFDFGGKA